MYTVVDQVVRASLVDSGYSTLHKYILRLHFALEGLYKLKRDGVYKVRKVVKLKMNSRNAVAWPADMLSVVKMGISIGNRILTFIPDDSISLNQQDHANDNSPNLLTQGFPLQAGPFDPAFDFLTFTNIYLSNGPQFLRGGAGSFVTKRFKVNEAAREFQLDGSFGGNNVYMEYIADCQTPNS
jgi:hypothetical protein